jgi:predicted regulator of Ras-like GTPase activity (Roadblock/LC7/MglB family)
MAPPKKKTTQIEVEEQVDWAPKIEEQNHAVDMRPTLEKIKTREGIIGYIIRGPTSASVDVKDPSKIIDYAALSAEATESSENLSNLFEMGKIKDIILESKNLKILSFKKGEQEVSIFMEKTVDHEDIFGELE